MISFSFFLVYIRANCWALVVGENSRRPVLHCCDQLFLSTDSAPSFPMIFVNTTEARMLSRSQSAQLTKSWSPHLTKPSEYVSWYYQLDKLWLALLVFTWSRRCHVFVWIMWMIIIFLRMCYIFSKSDGVIALRTFRLFIGMFHNTPFLEIVLHRVDLVMSLVGPVHLKEAPFWNVLPPYGHRS